MSAPELVYDEAPVQLYRGDCREVMAQLPDNSVDAIVTDPPYELGFMGKGWDSSGIAYDPEVWAQALRVLKPGGHLLAFGGTRTWHRVAVAVEDAGFEIRDSIAWLYGSGFPKSMDVSKAIDRQRHDGHQIRRVTAWIAEARAAAGITNRAIDEAFGFNGMAGHWTTQAPQAAIPTLEQIPKLLAVLGVSADEVPEEGRELIVDLNGLKGQPGAAWFDRQITQEAKGANRPGDVISFDQRSSTDRERRDIPASSAAKDWQGWGTALKPAFEPIVVARKPLVGTVAANVLAYGTGAINIDACRIATGENLNRPHGESAFVIINDDSWKPDSSLRDTANVGGRFPSNVVLDPSQAAELDRQSGISVGRQGKPSAASAGEGWGMTATGAEYDDHGGASRFFYVAKAGRDERPVVDGHQHATVKPLALMRYLVRMVTPPGGTVLEPFAGSGTTLEACVIEGFNVIAAELDEDGTHIPLIMQRLGKPHQQTLFGDVA